MSAIFISQSMALVLRKKRNTYQWASCLSGWVSPVRNTDLSNNCLFNDVFDCEAGETRTNSDPRAWRIWTLSHRSHLLFILLLCFRRSSRPLRSASSEEVGEIKGVAGRKKWMMGGWSQEGGGGGVPPLSSSHWEFCCQLPLPSTCRECHDWTCKCEEIFLLIGL